MKADMTGFDAAFKMLRKFGILCRKNFWCCQTCGCEAMRQRYEQAEADAKPLGYCFYHQQDAEWLRSEGHAYLSFNAFGEGDSVYIGRLIAYCMAECGVTVKWDGTASQRIEVDLTAGARVPA